ncbi:hydrolase or metal-binding protein [Pseudomonas sp.]|uniref:recombination directionality factor n=1 Tax=Pseudomonas sp. TaxID=306 RepID=UPI00289ACEA1|nr:hydrolase or metal-binding protein [Pseudomonas sp.]
MLKGLALTPPVLGRISIGKVIEKNGKRLPEKDDQFTITSQVQGKDGWLLHPLNDGLRQGKDDKLRSIPVRLLFNEPELNFRADYTLFDRQSGRPLCVGNGETCKRITQDGMQSLPCPSPDACPLAKGNACRPYGRLNVVIGDEDPLGSFVFRTTGFNSIRTLAARLHYFQAISGNRLACLPLELRLRGKSTRQSHGTPIFYVDLTVRSGLDMAEALQAANELDAQRQAISFDQAALDEAAQRGFANGAFEDSEEDASTIVEEFYPVEESQSPAANPPQRSAKNSLAERLEAQAKRHTPWIDHHQGADHATAQAESQ